MQHRARAPGRPLARRELASACPGGYLAGDGGDVRCAVLTGDDLTTMRPAFQQANELTRWMSAGVEYSLFLRPLLPDESGCEAAF